MSGMPQTTAIVVDPYADGPDDDADLYAVLGVFRFAGLEEIKRAHRNLARRHHPDKVGDDATLQEEAKMLMQRLNWAKEVLVAKRA